MGVEQSPIKLLLAGDICLGEHFFNCGSGHFSMALKNDVIDPLVGVRSAVNSADLFLFNLEGPVSLKELREDDIYSRCFRGHPGVLEHLKLAGKNIASIANNHLMQHGSGVARDTFRNLKQCGLDLVGLQYAGNESLCQPNHQEINGKRISLLSWSWVEEQHVESRDVLYAKKFDDHSLAQITECAAEADLLIVSIHAGVECQFDQNELSEQLRAIAEAGADVVVVHHSHFFHRIERWQDSIIFYGLGNFVFDLLWHRLLTTSNLIEIEFSNKIECLHVIPVSLGMMGLPCVNGLKQQIDMAKIKHGQSLYLDPRPFLSDQIPLAAVKLKYFFLNLNKGKSRLKFSFLWDKVYTLLMRIRQ